MQRFIILAGLAAAAAPSIAAAQDIRRAFLERLGMAGGVGATNFGMQALGLLHTRKRS